MNPSYDLHNDNTCMMVTLPFVDDHMTICCMLFPSLEDVTKELNSFIGIFNHLTLLFTPACDTSPPLLDADCKSSVLGE